MQKIRTISQKFNEILQFENFEITTFCHPLTDVDSVALLESFWALKLSKLESFRALKLTLLEIFRALPANTLMESFRVSIPTLA